MVSRSRRDFTGIFRDAPSVTTRSRRHRLQPRLRGEPERQCGRVSAIHLKRSPSTEAALTIVQYAIKHGIKPARSVRSQWQVSAFWRRASSGAIDVMAEGGRD